MFAAAPPVGADSRSASVRADQLAPQRAGLVCRRGRERRQASVASLRDGSRKFEGAAPFAASDLFGSAIAFTARPARLPRPAGVMAHAQPVASSSGAAASAPRSHVCVSLTAPTVEECLSQMEEAAAGGADLLELRLDFIKGLDEPGLKRILEARPRPVIVTNRPTRERGFFEGSEEARLALLEAAARLGAEYVDVEYDCAEGYKRQAGEKLILSYHNYTSTPPYEELRALHDHMRRLGADVTKVATFAQRLTDNLEVFRLTSGADSPCIGLCMGECGVVARVLAPKYNSFLSFAALREGREAAPGQVALATLINRYRFKSIGPETAVYGVIASPVGHSMSPALHNAALASLGIDAVYLPLLCEPEDLADTIAAFAGRGPRWPAGGRAVVQGYSVTIPHKETIMALCDEIDPVAKAIGAANTLTAVGGGSRIHATNTDWLAAISAAEEGVRSTGAACDAARPLTGRTVLVLGAGGAGRALAFGALERGAARVLVSNRTLARAAKLAAEVGADTDRCEAVDATDPTALAAAAAAADVVLNATAVGMHPKEEETPLPAGLLRPGTVVFDSVYNPLETRLLREARAAGAATVGGIEMFVGQAAAQFEGWTGRAASAALMRDTVLAILRERQAAQRP
eukprot:tig00000310_g23963.t1